MTSPATDRAPIYYERHQSTHLIARCRKLDIAFFREAFYWDDIVAAVAVLTALTVLLYDSSLLQ